MALPERRIESIVRVGQRWAGDGRIKWRWGEKKGTKEGTLGVAAYMKGHLRVVWKPNIVEDSPNIYIY